MALLALTKELAGLFLIVQALPTLFDLSVYWPGPGFLAALFDAPNYGRRDVPNPKPDFR